MKKFILIFGLSVLMVALVISATVENDSKVNHNITYTEYKQIDTYAPVVVSTSEFCFFNDTTQAQDCYEATSHTEYQVISSVFIPIESSRVEKVEDIDGSFREVKNSYSKDGVLSIWKVPLGDRNYDEFGSCRKYEIDKGVCKQVFINE